MSWSICVFYYFDAFFSFVPTILLTNYTLDFLTLRLGETLFYEGQALKLLVNKFIVAYNKGDDWSYLMRNHFLNQLSILSIHEMCSNLTFKQLIGMDQYYFGTMPDSTPPSLLWSSFKIWICSYGAPFQFSRNLIYRLSLFQAFELHVWSKNSTVEKALSSHLQDWCAVFLQRLNRCTIEFNNSKN